MTCRNGVVDVVSVDMSTFIVPRQEAVDAQWIGGSAERSLMTLLTQGLSLE